MHDDNDTNKETTGVEERVSLAMSDDIIPVSPFFFAIRVALNVPEQKERCSLCNCEWYSEVVKSDTTFVNITEGLSKQVLF